MSFCADGGGDVAEDDADASLVLAPAPAAGVDDEAGEASFRSVRQKSNSK